MVKKAGIVGTAVVIVIIAIVVVYLPQLAPPAPTPTSTTKPPENPPEQVVVEPSPVSLWAESEVGPVYAEETHYVKPSPDGRYLYAFNMDSRNIVVLNLETRTIIGNIKMPGFWSQATDMIFSSDGRWMYTLNAASVGDRHVVVIDTTSKRIDRLILLPEEQGSRFGGPVGPHLAISPDEKFLYVSLSGGIYRVDVENGRVIRVSDIKGIPSMAFSSDGEQLLGANMMTNSLDIIDPESGELIDTVPVGDLPQYMLKSSSDDRVYVSNWDSGDVSVVDLDARMVVATIPVGVNPSGMTVTPDGRKLYVAVTAQALEHVEGDLPFKVAVVDTTTYTVVKEIKPGWAPRFVNISPDGSKVYVNEYQGRVNIIDTATDEVVDSMLLTSPMAYFPDDIAITPDGSKLLVHANGIHQVMIIDTATHALLARFDAFSNAIAISSDGQRAYIPGFQFTVIDIPSLTARYVEMPDIQGGNSKIVLSKDESTAYVADAQKDILQVVDLENWRLISNVPVGDMGSPEFGLAITPDGDKIFVCNGYSKDISVFSTAQNKVIDTIQMESAPVSMGFSPDGGVGYVIELQSDVRGITNVVAIDVATHEIIRRWEEPIGFGNPWEVVISPDGQRAYFGGVDGEIVVIMDIENYATRYVDVGIAPFNLDLTRDGRLLFVSNTNSDDITVIDTQTETAVGRIPIQLEGMGFIYATISDSHGDLISIGGSRTGKESFDILINFVQYDKGVEDNFESWGSAPPHYRLDGAWIPVPEGDYMLWVNTNREDLRFVSQIYDGISDFEKLSEAPRVRVGEGQITSVNFVLQDGHQVSGTLVDQDGNPFSSGGHVINTQAGVKIGGCIGFGSGEDGRFFVNVPDGVSDLYFEGILVASGISVYADVDLGEVIFRRS